MTSQQKSVEEMLFDKVLAENDEVKRGQLIDELLDFVALSKENDYAI